MRSTTEADVPTERATLKPTVLSTVWEGPSKDDSTDGVDGYRRALDLGAGVARSRLFRWLFAPATRRGALVITIVAAVVCGGVLAIGEMEERPSVLSTARTDASTESTGAGLTSRAVVTDADEHDETSDQNERGVGDEPVGAGQVQIDPAPVPREAVSADERIRLTATAVQTAAGGWMLEAQVVDTAGSDPTVRFTVNGAVVEEVERAPYRLLLNVEVLASSPYAVGDGKPLIVTATAVQPDGDEAAGPATVVLPN